MGGLSYVIETIREKQRQEILSDEIFFRGQREQQELVPRLLRKNMHFRNSLTQTENNFFCDAWVMGATESSRPTSSWETLALFQHYEIPTRQLDHACNVNTLRIAGGSGNHALAIQQSGSSTRTECTGASIPTTRSRTRVR